MALLIVADLLVIADHYAPYNPPGEMYPPVPFTQALQALGPGALFVVGQDDEQPRAFLANSATVYRLRDLNVYDAIIALRGHTFMDTVNRLGPNRNQVTVLEANYAPDYHRASGEWRGYVVLPTSDAEPPDTGGHLVFQLESDDSKLEAPLPPLRVADDVTQTFVAPTDDLSAVGVYVANDTPGGG